MLKFLNGIDIKARRKFIALEELQNPVARAVINSSLFLYSVQDLLVARRNARADDRSEKLVSHERRFMVVLVPKSGSRTLYWGLVCSGQVPDLRILERSIHDIGFVDDAWTTLAVVRDPWSRAFSCYRQKVERMTYRTKMRLFNGREGIRKGMSFAEFVCWLNSEHGRDGIADRHWLSQHLILGLDRGRTYDHVIRLDRLDDSLDLIERVTGVEAGHFGHALKTSEPLEYLDHYDRTLVDMIAERYAGDIEAFGFAAPNLPAPEPQRSAMV